MLVAWSVVPFRCLLMHQFNISELVAGHLLTAIIGNLGACHHRNNGSLINRVVEAGPEKSSRQSLVSPNQYLDPAIGTSCGG